MVAIRSDGTPPEAPSRVKDVQKKQPWREIYPYIVAATMTDGTTVMKKPVENIAVEWNHLERGLLPRHQEELLAQSIQMKYQGKPWYKEAKLVRCNNCGNSPCSCSVFEGG